MCTILLALNFNMGTSVAVKQALEIYFRYLMLRMLQVSVNRRNYKFYVHIVKFNVCIYKISKDRINGVKLLHTYLQRSLSWMNVVKGLTWIDINLANLITMHVLIILRSSCLIVLGMFRLTNMRIACLYACLFVSNKRQNQVGPNF